MDIEERQQLRKKVLDFLEAHGLEHKLHEGKLSFASEERISMRIISTAFVPSMK